MAPALTAEPLSPKEKLTSNASPATRQSSRKLEATHSPTASSTSSDITASAVKKPATPSVPTTRVTRSKDAGQRTASPIVQLNNKRKTNNNNNTSGSSSGGGVKHNNEQMGLSAAPTHTPNSDSSSSAAAPNSNNNNNNNSSNSSSSSSNAATSPVGLADAGEHNNNCKDNSTAQLLADLTFEEAITAEICLRKTLPEVSLGKEAPAATNLPLEAASPPMEHEQSTSAAAAAGTTAIDAATCAELSQLIAVQEESAVNTLEIVENLAAGLDMSAAELEATVAMPTPGKQQQPARASGTPQSTASSSINFLKDGVTGAVLEDQDIEEVLKALKTLDGPHANPDTDAICDFNFFNEVCFLNNEEEAAATGAALQAPAPTASCSAPLVVKQRPLLESHAELEQQQHVLVRKIDWLLRRMRKLQARQMCRHSSDEIAGIFEWAARSSNKAPQPVRSTKLSDQAATVMSIVSGRPASDFWQEQKKQALPAPQISNLLRHIESVARQQQVSHTIGSGSSSLAPSATWYSAAAVPGKRPRKQQPPQQQETGAKPTDARMARSDEIVPILDSYVTSELSHVAGLLNTEMREVQQAIDSEATESSSGGESADEMVTYNNSQQLSLPIARRAVWRYSRDRASIALRWSWLCAQIADLDMKIRQHNDLYNDLTRGKGAVLLAKNASTANGYKAQDEDQLCSRTQPLILSEFRKRKLFQTTNMHTISKKAARPSNIKCGCQWPQVPCTVCTGRPDPTAPRDLPETLMQPNRVSLLDAGYHPMLSFADDISQSLHLEAIGRQPDWQYRVMRCQAKAIVKGVWKAERELLAASGQGAGRRPGDTVKRRYVRRKERNATTANGGGGAGDSGNGTGTATTSTSTTPTTTPLVANTAATTAKKPQQRSMIMGRNSQQQQMSAATNSHRASLISSLGNGNEAKRPRNKQANYDNNSINSSNNNNIHNSTLNGDNKARFLNEPWEQQARGRRNSPPGGKRPERYAERRSRMIYDIDNIVIPYSVAAATRVEILPYKEIPTPKWRVIESDSKRQQQPHSEGQQQAHSEGQQQAHSEGQSETHSEGQQQANGEPLSNGCGATTTPTIVHNDQVEEEKTRELLTSPKPEKKVNGVREQTTTTATQKQTKNNNNTLVNGNAMPKEKETEAETKSLNKKPNNKANHLHNNHKKALDTTTTDANNTLEASEPPGKRAKLELKLPKGGEELTDAEPDDENEDISDEAYIVRHQRALLEEQRRFETFLKFPWSTRSRANRRVDSRAESSGANTPDPTSPAPHLLNESIPSPLAHTMLDTLNEAPVQEPAISNRRRTTSSKLKDLERRSATPDLNEEQMSPSFEPLQFPLSDEVYQRLLAEQFAEPKPARVKRLKSKSISSNCGDGGGSSSTAGGSRRSSKAKSTSKLALPHINGGDADEPDQMHDVDYEHLAADEIMLEEEEEYDDDYPKHHLAPLDDEQLPPNEADALYDACLDAYIGGQALDEEELDEADDPFMDDDPNDPEWKRSLSVRHERMRKRI